MKIIKILAILFVLAGCQPASTGNVSNSLNEKQPDYASLQQQLEKIYDLDQGVRNVNWDSIESDPAVRLAYITKMWKIDTTNQGQVLPILEAYGWIPKSKIGEKAADAIFYVVQHSSKEILEKYLPQMEALARQGEASATDAAKMRDRLLMWNGKKQLYGTQGSGGLREGNEIAIWPIEDPENVNKRRKEVGFTTTVEENAKRLGAVYDPNEKLPEKKN